MPDRPYQIGPDDKDFLTLSARLGIDYNALRRANPSVQSLSLGQHINLPGYNQMNQPGYNPLQSVGGILGETWGQVKGYFNQAGNVIKQQPETQAMGQYLGNNFSLGNTLPNSLYAPKPKLPAAIPQAPARSAPGMYLGQGVYLPSQAGNFGQSAASTSNPDAMSAYRQQEYIASQVTAIDQYYQQNGYLPANISPEVKAAMIAQGANPADIQKLQQEGAAQQAYGGGSDPLAGTPGHYYVDETTAPFVNRIIEVNGRRRILRQDKEGRLFYQKPGQSRRGRARNRLNARLAEQVLPAADFRPDNPVTVLNVILGS